MSDNHSLNILRSLFRRHIRLGGINVLSDDEEGPNAFIPIARFVGSELEDACVDTVVAFLVGLNPAVLKCEPLVLACWTN